MILCKQLILEVSTITVPPFFPENMNGLFIRHSYNDLFDRIISNLHNEDPRSQFHRMAITDNPGIGKSFFLFYIMWEILIMDGVGTVILRCANDRGQIKVFQENKCWTTQHRHFRNIISI